MLGKVAPVVSLTLVYCAGYSLTPLARATWARGVVAAPDALIAAALALGLARFLLWRSPRRRTTCVSLTLLCFFLCGVARETHSEAEKERKTAALERLCSGAGHDGTCARGAAAAFDRAPAGCAESPRDVRMRPYGGSGRDAAAENVSREIRARGLVVTFPREMRDGTRFVVGLLEARESRQEVPLRERPRLLVTMSPAADVRYGDLLRIDGRCAIPRGPRNPGGFDRAGYLSAMDVQGTIRTRPCRVRLLGEGMGFSVLSQVIGPVRRWVRVRIDQVRDGETRGLLRGLLLGDRSGMEWETRDSMARAGVIHVLAVSGLHVGLVALIVAWAARIAGLSGPSSELIAALGALFYCALTGFPASACRATTMLSAYVACRRLQRAGGAFQSLAVAAFALVLFKPEWVSTAGFQLSFAAAAGVLAFKDCLCFVSERTGLRRVPVLRGLPALFAASLGACAATWPLLAFHFGRVPLLFLPGNAAAVPLAGLVLAWGICGVLFGAFSSVLSGYMFGSCWAASKLLLWCSRLVSSVPWASIDVGPFNPILIPLYYVALIAAVWLRGRRRAAAAGAACLIAVLMYIGPPRGDREGALEAVFLDVGHGDACVMLAPTGECMLVDAGGASQRWDSGRDVILPFLRSRRVRRIDRVVISHRDSDHWGGLPEMCSRVRIGEIVLPRGVPTGDLGGVVSRIARRGAKVRWAAAGDTLDPLGDLHCTVLHPSPEFAERSAAGDGAPLNDSSLVLRVTYGAAVFLFPGDIEGAAERRLVEQKAPLRCAVLKVPHHGSDTSSGEDFVRETSPLVAVVSCGPRELFNLPKPEVLARYAAAGAACMLTAREGAVIVRTDGRTLWGESCLNPARAFRIDLRNRAAGRRGAVAAAFLGRFPRATAGLPAPGAGTR